MCLEGINQAVKQTWTDAMEDLKRNVQKYPILSIITTIAFTILGVTQLVGASFFAIVGGLLFLAMAAGIIYSITRDAQVFCDQVKASFDKIKNGNPEPEVIICN